MSKKHNRWAWLKPRRLALPSISFLLFGGLLSTARLHRNTSGKLSAENVGYGLAVAGGIMALAVLLGLLFVPVASFPTIDAEMGALLAAILFVAGIIVHAAD